MPYTFLHFYTLHEVSGNKITIDFMVLYIWRAVNVVIDSVPPSVPFFTIGDDGVEMSRDVFPQQIKIKEFL